MLSLNVIWEKTLELLEKDLSATVINQWVKPLTPVKFESNELILALDCEVALFKSLIINTCQIPISNAASIVVGLPVSVTFIFTSDIPQYTKNTSINLKESNMPNNWLIKKYNFDNFIVGTSNNFAQAASLAVAENPAQAYNPLFLYGVSGLGKTHLMHAIGNHILYKNPDSKILYVTSENFTNELINSIKEKKTEQFRDKYRKMDVLLIDDIQFIAGKDATEEEFFHTFNHLHQANKQIIISSDRPPKDMQILEDRLRSRFEWGLICDIKPPSYETRYAILQNKAQHENIDVPNEVIDYIANTIDSNIRELEGALNKIKAFSELGRIPLTLESATNVLQDYSVAKNKVYTTAQIQKVVTNYFDLQPTDLTSQKRTKEISFARQIAMYICRNLLDYSLPKIGREFGGRDHTTVLHSINKIDSESKKDSNVKNILNDVLADIEKN